MPRQSVTLTAPQSEVLQAEADRLGISVSDLIRRIIDHWREARDREAARSVAPGSERRPAKRR